MKVARSKAAGDVLAGSAQNGVSLANDGGRDSAGLSGREDGELEAVRWEGLALDVRKARRLVCSSQAGVTRLMRRGSDAGMDVGKSDRLGRG